MRQPYLFMQKINYSESFIFRARCKYCGTRPSNRSWLSHYLPNTWDNIKQFQEYSNGYINIFYKNTFKNPPTWHALGGRIRDSKKKIVCLSITCNHNIFSQRKIDNFGLYCKCSKTLWTFANIKTLHEKRSRNSLTVD